MSHFHRNIHLKMVAQKGQGLVKLLLTVYCDPFVQVFAIRQHDCHAQVTTPQSSLCMFQQLVLVRSLRDILLGLEGFVSTVSTVCQIKKRKENSVTNNATDVMTEHEKIPVPPRWKC